MSAFGGFKPSPSPFQGVSTGPASPPPVLDAQFNPAASSFEIPLTAEGALVPAAAAPVAEAGTALATTEAGAVAGTALATTEVGAGAVAAEALTGLGALEVGSGGLATIPVLVGTAAVGVGIGGYAIYHHFFGHRVAAPIIAPTQLAISAPAAVQTQPAPVAAPAPAAVQTPTLTHPAVQVPPAPPPPPPAVAGAPSPIVPIAALPDNKLPEAHFAFDSAVISRKDALAIKKWVDTSLLNHSNSKIEVDGFVDAAGQKTAAGRRRNGALANLRAEAVADELKKDGVDPARIHIKAGGVAGPEEESCKVEGKLDGKNILKANPQACASERRATISLSG